MKALRMFLHDNRRLALTLAALALALKALVPAGYMLGTGSRMLTIQICADATGQPMTRQISVAVTDNGPAGHTGSGDTAPGKAPGLCAFSALAFGALVPVDTTLLAGALAFVILLGFAPVAMMLPRSGAWLRPPLRGPPISV